MTFFYLETRKQQINSVQPHLVEQCIGIFVWHFHIHIARVITYQNKNNWV
jgi:hypothetical protein